MSDGSLSQDEIDALLQGSGGMDFEEEPQSGPSDGITDSQIRAFTEVIGGTVDSQGSNFSMLVNTTVSMDRPSVRSVRRDALYGELDDEMVQILMPYTDGVSGDHAFFMSSSTALAIAGPMMGQDGVELDDAALNALQEAFSQIHGPVATAIGDKAGVTAMTGSPEGQLLGKDDFDLPSGDFVVVEYPVTIDDVESTVYEVFDKNIVDAIEAPAAPQAAPKSNPSPQQAQPQASTGFGAQTAEPQGGGFGGGAMGGMQDSMAGMFGGGQGGGPSVQSVQFPNLQAGSSGGEQGNISLLMDVYMEMTVELGRTRKLIKEILGMGEGTIIELDKLAGEPVDILVNHKLIAKGEVVVIDENFGVRVTEIVSPMERVNNMT
ncbi:MAG: flagellar motor switch protein FliN [Spirochaetaceae bacterium]|nr:MAG: flagellar motor switch protein FliN [Spirochaetaceae bacterium]